MEGRARNLPRATMAVNKAIIPKRLIHELTRGGLSFLHAENMQAQLIKAAHQAHEAIVNRTITTPEMTAVELTQASDERETLGSLAMLPHRKRGSRTTQRGLVQCKLHNLTGQSGRAGSRQSGRR